MSETTDNCNDISSNGHILCSVLDFNCAKYGSCVGSFSGDTVDMKLYFIGVVFI